MKSARARQLSFEKVLRNQINSLKKVAENSALKRRSGKPFLQLFFLSKKSEEFPID